MADSWTAISENPWNKELSEVDLTKSGFTFMTQVIGAEAPSVIPDIKINVSTYSKHRLNFYIPVHNRPDTVSNVSIVIEFYFLGDTLREHKTIVNITYGTSEDTSENLTYSIVTTCNYN